MLQCNDEVTVNQKSYKLIKLLGHGKGGYSYLAERENSLVVLKQIHHEPCSYYTFGNKIESEINDFKRLCDAGINIPKMLDVDIKSERIIKEFIDGELISDLVKNDRMKESYINQVRKMSEQAFAAGLNIDYFPTNFVVQKNQNNEEVLFYIDYECNNFMEEWSFENWGLKYWLNKEEL